MLPFARSRTLIVHSLFQDKQAIGIPTGSSQEYWRVKGSGDGLEL